MTISDILAAPPVYNLNAGQKEAADAFMEFLLSPEKNFIISGAAGVGKTYLMNYIIDNTMPRYHNMCKLIDMKPLYDDVIMTATTNKAADVLSQSTRRPTSTVHAFFNLTVKEDYSTGKTVLKKTTNWRVHENKIIFIDECSMIDTELWKVIQEGTLNCKVVYVGDHNQLAPIHDDLSPIYKHPAPFFNLTEPMRNSGQPGLMEVCQQLRETVETGIFKPIYLDPGVIDWLDDADMMDEIDKHFRVQTHESRILVYTNRRVIEYNDHIRNLRQLPVEYQAGDLLVNNTAFTSSMRTVPVEAEIEILENHGHSQVPIAPDVYLDVNLIDFKTDLEDIHRNIPYPVNREHYEALTKYYAKQKNWERFFYLKKQFIDLRPRDAATVHKSQGSSYNTVFIDLGNISTCNFTNQAARMLYVAFSRARQRVFLYGDLAEKYGGLVFP